MSPRYPLAEGFKYRYSCPGCGKTHRTTVPRHNAPFTWTCTAPECGWRMVVQTDAAGVSVGFTAPLAAKPDLYLVEPPS